MPDPFKLLGVDPERAKQGAAYAGTQALDLLYSPLYMKALGDALSSFMGSTPQQPQQEAPTPEAAPYQALTGALMEPLRRVGQEQSGRVAELEALYPQFVQEALTGMRGLGEQYGEANPELGPLLAMMSLFRPDGLSDLAKNSKKLTKGLDEVNKVGMYPWHMKQAANSVDRLNVSPARVQHTTALWRQAADRHLKGPLDDTKAYERLGHNLYNFEKAITAPKHRRAKRMTWWLEQAESSAKINGVHDQVDWAPLRRLLMKHASPE